MEKAKKKEKAKKEMKPDKGNRNPRCRALMAFARAKKAKEIEEQTGKADGRTYEDGNKQKIPKSLWPMVSTDPKGAFEKYFKAGASWDAVERQETNTEEDKTSDSCLRIWLFSGQVRSKICQKKTEAAHVS